MHAGNSAGLAIGTAGQMDGMELRVCVQLGWSKHQRATPANTEDKAACYY